MTMAMLIGYNGSEVIYLGLHRDKDVMVRESLGSLYVALTRRCDRIVVYPFNSDQIEPPTLFDSLDTISVFLEYSKGISFASRDDIPPFPWE